MGYTPQIKDYNFDLNSHLWEHYHRIKSRVKSKKPDGYLDPNLNQLYPKVGIDANRPRIC